MRIVCVSFDLTPTISLSKGLILCTNGSVYAGVGDVVKLLTEADVDGMLTVTNVELPMATSLIKGKLTCTNSRIFAQTNTVTELARMSDITTEASTRASVDTNLQNQVNSLNSSVSNGKQQVANAITGKGVAASGSDSFATLANKINQIKSATQCVFTATADGSGTWFMPPFGFVPRVYYAIQMRALDEGDDLAIDSIDFVLGISWGLLWLTLDTGDTGTRGYGSRFNPADFANEPNSSTNHKCVLNPNSYVNGLLYPIRSMNPYYYEYSQYLIYAIPA